jgi:tetratricopeptide (TPR) repeat protein
VNPHEPRDRSEAAADRAQELEDHGDLQGAIDVLSAAVRDGSSHPGLWHNLGLLRIGRGEWDLALEAFTEAIRRGYPSQVNRGLAFEKVGDAENAGWDYREALLRDPEDVDALVNLGTLEHARENTREAEDLLRAAARLDPKANWQLADVFIATDRNGEALEALDRAIEAGESRAYLDRARLLSTQSAADASADFVMAINAGLVAARCDYAVYLDRLGRPEDGLVVAKAGIELGDPFCYAPAAVISEELGQIESAIEYYRLAINSGDHEYESDLRRLLSE